MIFLLALNKEFNTFFFHHQDLFIKDEFHYLNVPRVGTHTVSDVFDCTFACLSSPSCLSLNMAASKGADGKLWCELLSSVKDSNPKEYNLGNKSSHHLFIQVGLILTETVLLTLHTYPQRTVIQCPLRRGSICKS